MLSDLSYQELEDIEHRLYSQLHHPSSHEEDVVPLTQIEMPRTNVSFRPVRYFLRRKGVNSPRSKEQASAKTVYSQDDNLKQSHSEIPSLLNGVFNAPKHKKQRAFKNVFKNLNKQRRKERQRLKKQAKRDRDVKPDISEIDLGNMNNTFNVNRHTIILSDSEDEVIDTSGGHCDNPTNIPLKNIENRDLVSDKGRNSSTDDDVIIVETLTENEVIEIDDSNLEQLDNSKTQSNSSNLPYKTNERSELLSTPESSASNDFLDILHANTTSNFNFGLHGSEFKDSEFLRPTVPVEISESGSISSVSDITLVKANVFSVADFPKEKENLFDENNLEKFKNSITPQRSGRKGVVEGSETDQRNLPILSDIQSDENQARRTRGRSIIRELVNDRAYVLLSSSQQKSKCKKRKSRSECSDSLVGDTEVSESVSPELARKKKRKKDRKGDDGTGSYNEFTEDSETNNLISSSPVGSDVISSKKNRKKKGSNLEEIVENEETANEFKLIVRSDLFVECESDNSMSSKKGRKKKSEHHNIVEAAVECDEKRKQKRSRGIEEQAVEIPVDSSKKRKKERLLKECRITNDNVDRSGENKRRKSKSVETDDIIQINDDEENVTLNCTEDVQGNDTKKKRRKKKSTSESEISKKLEDGRPCRNTTDVSDNESFVEIQEDPTTDKSDQNNIEADGAPRPYQVYFRSRKKKSISETDVPHETHQATTEELQADNNISPDNNQSLIVELTSENTDKHTSVDKGVTEQPFPQTPSKPTGNIEHLDRGSEASEKPQADWNMCATKFFSSSESLFNVSTINGVPENKKLQENLIETTVTEASVLPILSPRNSLDDTSPVEVKLDAEHASEISKDISENVQTNSEIFNDVPNAPEVKPVVTVEAIDKANNDVIIPTDQVKIEKENDNTEPTTNVPSEKTSEPPTIAPQINESVSPIETLSVKEEPQPKETLNLSTNVSSTVSSVELFPDIVKRIVTEKDSAVGMWELCKFLEEVKDPNDVLTKVSMIKQAFLAKSENSIQPSSKEDDILSISSSDSSVICIENNTTVIDIEDDTMLANCVIDDSINKEVNTPFEANNVQVTLEQQVSSQCNITAESPKSSKKQESTQVVTQTTRAGPSNSNSKRKCETVEDDPEIHKFEVEAIQQFMPDDPKLWQISSADLPQTRPQPKGRRCKNCQERGHWRYNCPNKSVLPKCFLCGIAGHFESKCPNRLCTQCGRKASIMRHICDHCNHYRTLTCSLCKKKGHPRQKCPDMWRRYHLTTEHGPLVKGQGLKLKPKKKLWCSSCAKAGHLELNCQLPKRSIHFHHQLDPRIHSYEDVYDAEPDIGNTSDILGETVANSPTISSDASVARNNRQSISCDTSPTKGIPAINVPSTSLKTPPRVSLINSLVGVEDMVPNFVVIDEVFSTPAQRKDDKTPENEISLPVRESSESEISKNEQNVESPTKTLDGNKSSNEKDAPEKEISGIPAQIDHCVSNVIPQRHFITSEVGSLKEFVRKELELLQSTPFKVKEFYYRFTPYEYGTNQSQIPVEKKQKFFKELNMLLFGKENFKAGVAHLRKLEVFVNTVAGTCSESARESLYYSYDYIFRNSKHENVNYEFFLKLLMRKYGNQVINGPK